MSNSVNKDEVAISVQNVKKTFRSYQDKATSFKERFINPSRGKHEDVMVLKGISFDVKKGEAIGIIGKNGCGKSTTLKLLTRILYPNEGKIEIKGRVSSLIELGAGFHPDMTGRENIYTKESIFGITRKEVDKRLGDIIRFSELEEYIDNPVRTYSSGMYMRLAFAVAINVDADVLLIDEILAVGDAAFQKKCFEKLKEIKANGTTIVIVSHSMEQMYKICDRLIWIENGLIRDEGVPKFIGEQYLAEMEGRRLDRVELEKQQKKEELERKIREEEELQHKEQEKEQKRRQEELKALIEQQKQIEKNETLKQVSKYCRPEARRGGNGKCLIKTVRVLEESGEEVQNLRLGENYVLEILLETSEELKEVIVSMGITREDGVYCYGNFSKYEHGTAKLKGEPVRFYFKNELLKGSYMLDLWVQSFEREIYDEIIGLQMLVVNDNQTNQRGIFSMDSRWE